MRCRTGEAIRVAITDVGLTYYLLKGILMGHPPRRDRRGFFVAYGMKHRLNRLSLGAASRVIPLPPVSVPSAWAPHRSAPSRMGRSFSLRARELRES